MEYSKITCGLRVMTEYGPGVVESFDATLPELRARLGGTVPRPLMASVQLDCGAKNEFPIKHLTLEGGE